MKPIPLVAAVNDLSGFGRCSLTVALPILSAMGLQGCPLPTALLSNHTGYPSCFFEDFTDRMETYLAEWRKLGLRFGGACTGFLGNEKQADIVAGFLSEFCDEGAVKLVDPVMADNGQPYSTCSPVLCERMKTVVAQGTVTTPNLTEACLLTGRSYAAILSLPDPQKQETVFAMADAIAALGPRQVIVTGVVGDHKVANLVSDRGAHYAVERPLVPCSFAGTGDVFAAVLFGLLMRNTPLKEAVERTAAFVADATAHTMALGLPAQDGIEFEPFLSRLTEGATV